RADLFDARHGVGPVRDDRRLRSREAERLHPAFPDGHREQRHRDALACTQQEVQLPRMPAPRILADPVRQREQLVRRIAHRGHDHHHIAAAAALRRHPCRHLPDPLRATHRRATVLLDDERHRFAMLQDPGSGSRAAADPAQKIFRLMYLRGFAWKSASSCWISVFVRTRSAYNVVSCNSRPSVPCPSPAAPIADVTARNALSARASTDSRSRVAASSAVANESSCAVVRSALPTIAFNSPPEIAASMWPDARRTASAACPSVSVVAWRLALRSASVVSCAPNIRVTCVLTCWMFSSARRTFSAVSSVNAASKRSLSTAMFSAI